jgi:hypothetical protein
MTRATFLMARESPEKRLRLKHHDVTSPILVVGKKILTNRG